MIDSDPLFANAAAGDLHLTWNSPCKDAGEKYPPVDPSTDFEGDYRCNYPFDDDNDIGADEFNFHVYHLGDVAPGAAIDINGGDLMM